MDANLRVDFANSAILYLRKPYPEFMHFAGSWDLDFRSNLWELQHRSEYTLTVDKRIPNSKSIVPHYTGKFD